MELIVLGCNDQDMKEIWTHLFTRQKSILIKDNCGYVKIDIDSMKELSFLSCVLNCKFVFTPQNFEHNDIKYPTIEIIRGDEKCESSYCGDRILTKEQVLRDLYTRLFSQLPWLSQSRNARLRRRERDNQCKVLRRTKKKGRQISYLN